MSTATDIITLTHNQVIRVKGFYRSTSRIFVRTQEGIIAQFGAKPCNEHGELAWVYQESAALDANYPGKEEAINAKKAQIAAAPEIENGQPVIIEGRCYRVKVNGQQYCDPVKFISDSSPL